MKESNHKLILPLSNLVNDARIENYLDYGRTCELMSENELLFIVEESSGFLSIKEPDVVFPYYIMHCINVIAKKFSLVINSKIKDNKAVSHFGGSCKGLIIDVS